MLIERLPRAEIDETVKAQVMGEAKFVRALSYFYLARLDGDVPLVTTTEEQLGQPDRTPKVEVFAQIMRDAQEAGPLATISGTQKRSDAWCRC